MPETPTHRRPEPAEHHLKLAVADDAPVGDYIPALARLLRGLRDRREAAGSRAAEKGK
jgi:hypothetical protein